MSKGKELLEKTGKEVLEEMITQYNIKTKEVDVEMAKLNPAYAVEATTLSSEDSGALRASQKSIGTIYPLVITNQDEILDGCHRMKNLQDQGKTKARAIMLIDVPEGLKAVIAYHLNFSRRNASSDIKHEAYTNFETRILDLCRDKSYNEAVKLFPDLSRYVTKKDEDKPLDEKDIKHAIRCFAGVSYHTVARWLSEEKAKEEMAVVHKDSYPDKKAISTHDVKRYMSKRQQTKKSKGSSMLWAVCGTFCRNCAQADSCSILSAIYNRKCLNEANQEASEGFANVELGTEDEKQYSNPKMILAEYFRRRRGIPLSDKAWSLGMLPRVLKEAEKLYTACGSNLDIARFCIDRTGNKYDDKKLSWALTTVLKELKESEQQWNSQHPTQTISLKA